MAKDVYLVTGAAGFIGANLCRRLVDEGEETHVFTRSSSDLWRLSDVEDKLEIHTVDICDESQVNAAVDAVKPSVIYHLATHGAYHYQTNADSILLTNVFGLWNLLHACEGHGYRLFVNTGSSSEYGRKDHAMRETDNLEPDSYYAVAKSAQSLLARHYSRISDAPMVTLRLFSVYGPYEEPTRLVPSLMMSALRGEPLKMAGRDTARDFVFIDDVVDVYRNVAKLEELRGEILNVGTGVQNSLSDIVNITESLIGKKLAVDWDALDARMWDSEVWVADASKLRRLLGASPRTTLTEGLTDCLAWFSEHGDYYRHGNG